MGEKERMKGGEMRGEDKKRRKEEARGDEKRRKEWRKGDEGLKGKCYN